MRGKILIVTGLAVGYVLGARAGRGRYEEIKRAATKFWNDPRVKQQVETVEDFAKDKGWRQKNDPVQLALYSDTLQGFRLAAQGKTSVSVLDWGGGVGLFALLARAVLPGVAVIVTNIDTGLARERGRGARVRPAHPLDHLPLEVLGVLLHLVVVSLRPRVRDQEIAFPYRDRRHSGPRLR